MPYGRLLDENGHCCEPLTDLSYPVVLLQRGESRGDRFVESLRRDLYGVLNVSKILYCNRARSEDHSQKPSIFAFYSPQPVPLGVTYRSYIVARFVDLRCNSAARCCICGMLEE